MAVDNSHDTVEHVMIPNAAAAIPNENQAWLESNSNLHHVELENPQQAAGSGGAPPSNLEYRLDGEVLQLTRVAQDEALRLVNSGATVIYSPATDESEPMPGPSRG